MNARRRAGRGSGSTVVSLVAAAATLSAAALAGHGCVADNSAEPPGGDLNHFGPVAAYEGVAAFAGPGAELLRMEIWHLRSDGTLDLEAKYGPRAKYQFVRPEVKTKDDEALPVGARGTKPTGLEIVNVEVSEPRMWSVTVNGNRHDERHLGMDRTFAGPGSAPPEAKKDVLPAPKCDLGGLWAEAVAAGAPKDAVAAVAYDRDGWRFTIAEVEFSLVRTGADCTGKTKAAEAGAAPTAP